MIRLLALALFLAIALHAKAAPPEGASAEFAPWFQGLKQPETGVSCCSIADCRIFTDDKVRLVEGAYQVYIDGEWRPVLAERVLQRISNPTGGYVACYVPSQGVLCLVRPAET